MDMDIGDVVTVAAAAALYMRRRKLIDGEEYCERGGRSGDDPEKESTVGATVKPMHGAVFACWRWLGCQFC